MIAIDYVTSVQGSTRRLTKADFLRMTEAPHTRSLIERCRSGNVREMEEAKRLLAGICWQATYKDNRRIETGAQPNGLCALDIDHISRQKISGISTPEELWQSFKERVDELDIVCVHKTPSGDGLRVVFLCQPQFQTIAENQAWLAGELRCIHDPVCKDWARLYFISVSEDFYYVDWETLFE